MSQSLKPPREDLFWVNYIRMAAAFGVVLVHVAADVITEWGVVPNDWWWSANIYDSLARGCVPMFIMVSGALLLPVQESYRDFFRKRFNRIFIPFVVWTLLYLLWKKVFYLPALDLPEAVRKIISGNVCFHLWFFYVLAGMYLLTPVFRILIAHARRRDLFYFIILWFAAGSFLPFAEKAGKMAGLPGFHFNLPMEPVQGFIGYFVLGYFIRQYAVKEWMRPAAVLWTACLFVCLIGTWAITSHFHVFKEFFYDNMAPNIVLYCAAFFVLVKFIIPSAEVRWHPVVKNSVIGLSKASFGIYLIHPMILDAMVKGRLGFTLRADAQHPAYMILILAVMGYLGSFFIVAGIQRVPLLKRIV